MLEVSGPQLKPLAELLLQFDRKGMVPTIYNTTWPANQSGKIVLFYPHRFYNERYIISKGGIISRKDFTREEL